MPELNSRPKPASSSRPALKSPGRPENVDDQGSDAITTPPPPRSVQVWAPSARPLILVILSLVFVLAPAKYELHPSKG